MSVTRFFHVMCIDEAHRTLNPLTESNYCEIEHHKTKWPSSSNNEWAPHMDRCGKIATIYYVLRLHIWCDVLYFFLLFWTTKIWHLYQWRKGLSQNIYIKKRENIFEKAVSKDWLYKGVFNRQRLSTLCFLVTGLCEIMISFVVHFSVWCH